MKISEATTQARSRPHIPARYLREAERAIASVDPAHELSRNGLGQSRVFPGALNIESVATTLLFLDHGPVTALRYIPKWCGTSYGWKHKVERWGRDLGFAPYVANGDFICAAMWRSVRMRRCSGAGSPNAEFALRELRP